MEKDTGHQPMIDIDCYIRSCLYFYVLLIIWGIISKKENCIQIDFTDLSQCLSKRHLFVSFCPKN